MYMQFTSSSPLNWGILGPGKIARSFARDLALVPGNRLLAVGSRSADKAAEFALEFHVPRTYGSYETLLADPELDIVYIATPHDSHEYWSLRAMEAGKHVLCEKPAAVNAVQLARMTSCARERGVFFMEALWSRFNPSIMEVIQRVSSGDIGTIQYIHADFSIYRDPPADHRLVNPHLAGGALLDLGIYPVFLAVSLLGTPEDIRASAQLHPSGVDAQTVATLHYKEAVVQLMCGIRSQSDMRARIYGTGGSFFLEPVWHETQSYTWLNLADGSSTHYPRPTLGKGYSYEIMECMSCVRAGLQESPLWSWENSRAVISILDEIRRQTGVIYPFEKP